MWHYAGQVFAGDVIEEAIDENGKSPTLSVTTRPESVLQKKAPPVSSRCATLADHSARLTELGVQVHNTELDVSLPWIPAAPRCLPTWHARRKSTAASPAAHLHL